MQIFKIKNFFITSRALRLDSEMTTRCSSSPSEAAFATTTMASAAEIEGAGHAGGAQQALDIEDDVVSRPTLSGWACWSSLKAVRALCWPAHADVLFKL